MRIITNRFIPFGDFNAMNTLGLVFTREEEKNITPRVKRHEGTHTYQQYELLMIAAIVSLVLCNMFASWWYLLFLLIIPFAIYVMAFLLELAIPPYHNAQLLWNDKTIPLWKRIGKWLTKVWIDAYADNCFEREAYMNDNDPLYNSVRHFCAWLWYILPRNMRKGK